MVAIGKKADNHDAQVISTVIRDQARHKLWQVSFVEEIVYGTTSLVNLKWLLT